MPRKSRKGTRRPRAANGRFAKKSGRKGGRRRKK